MTLAYVVFGLLAAVGVAMATGLLRTTTPVEDRYAAKLAGYAALGWSACWAFCAAWFALEHAGMLPAALEMMDNAIIRAVEASVFAAGLPTDAEAVLKPRDGFSHG